jgi:hypothetical protein
MKTRILPLIVAGAVSAGLLFLSPRSGAACPFCSAPSVAFSEQISKADVFLLVKFDSAKRSEGDDLGSTTYEIVTVPKDRTEGFKKSDKLTLERYREGEPGELAVVFGNKFEKMEWSDPVALSEAGYEYLTHMPPFDAPATVRLPYFLNYLEHPDQAIANDAMSEFAMTPYEQVASVRDFMPRNRIRGWINDPKTPPTRLGFYGLLLGLCGDDSDRILLEEKITTSTDEFRIGIDGVMSGYLLLAGEPGLKLLVEKKFKDRSQHFSEVYAAMMAIRFMWEYGDKRLSHESLRAAMRELMDRSEMADLVITNLARWKDWSVGEKLEGLYGQGDYNVPSIKRAIIRYMLSCIAAAGEEDGPTEAAVARAKAFVEEAQKKDPRLVEDVKRFMVPLNARGLKPKQTSGNSL